MVTGDRSNDGRAADVAVLKRCNCGRAYTRVEWDALPRAGTMDDPELARPIDLRHCAGCGSTIAIEIEIAVPLNER